MDLFSREPIAQPLAARLRATNLDEYVGQEHVLAHGKPCNAPIRSGDAPFRKRGTGRGWNGGPGRTRTRNLAVMSGQL